MLNKKYTQWFTQSTIDTLEAYGNCKIIKLFVGKYNIFYRFFRFSILNVLSDGAWSKELYKRNSNKLKHTYIICRIVCPEEDNKEYDIIVSKEFTFTCEKHEYWLNKYNINEETRELSVLEIESFDPTINLNINTLLEQTIKNIGDERFFIWTPVTSCQDFVKDILLTVDAFNYKRVLYDKTANNIRLYNDNVQNFVVQNLNNIFEVMPERLTSFMEAYNMCMKRVYNIS